MKMSCDLNGHETNHPGVAQTLYDIGLVYEALGKQDEAISSVEECLKMRRSILGMLSTIP